MMNNNIVEKMNMTAKEVATKISELETEITKLKEELDIKTRAINAYQKSVIEAIAPTAEKKQRVQVIKVTPDQFSEIFDTIVCNALDYDKEKHGYDLDDLTEKIHISWMGVETTLTLGPEIDEYFMEAIVDCYKEQI